MPLNTVNKRVGYSNVETTARFYVNSSRKEKMQALVCVMGKLVNIVYRMMRNRMEYMIPADLLTTATYT